jgi:hypothetical protein
MRQADSGAWAFGVDVWRLLMATKQRLAIGRSNVMVARDIVEIVFGVTMIESGQERQVTLIWISAFGLDFS